MSEKKYSLHEVTESLRISPDTLYRWESQIPDLKPAHCNGGRFYTSWEFDLVQHAHRLFHNYNQDFAGTRSALERWISKNPKPFDSQQDSSDHLEAIDASQVIDSIVEANGSQSLLVEEADNEFSVQVTEAKLSSVSAAPPNKEISLENPEAKPAVIQQGGGKQRVIGRTHEDLFSGLDSDLDSDPFDLSPKPRGDFDLISESKRSTSVDQAKLLTPSLIDLEQNYSTEWSHTPQTSKATKRLESPSNSDWLERSTSVETTRLATDNDSSLHDKQSTSLDIDKSTDQVGQFSPQRAFSRLDEEHDNAKDNDSKESLQKTDNSSRPSMSPTSNLDTHTSTPAFTGANTSSLTPIPVKRSIKSPYGAQKAMPVSSLSTSSVAQISGGASLSSNYLKARNDISLRETQNQRESQSSQIPIPTDQGDQEAWQRAYHHSQAQLARAKGELARAQESVNQQHKEIKLLKTQLLSVKESILKEIYDLRDLVVDK